MRQTERRIPDNQPRVTASDTVARFKRFMEERRDELAALRRSGNG